MRLSGTTLNTLDLFPYQGYWSEWLGSGRYHAEKDQENGLLVVQSMHKIVQPIFPFVNEACPSNVEATLKPMMFYENVQDVEEPAFRFANKGTISRIRREWQRCWRTSQLQGVYGAQHAAVFLILPIAVHVV